MNENRLAGTICLVASLAFLFLVWTAIHAYDGYDFSGQYLSELAIHPQAGAFFFWATVLMGLALVSVAVLCWKTKTLPASVAALLVVGGVGLVGVGVFDLTVEPHHTLAAGLAFVGVGLAALDLAWNWFKQKKTAVFLGGCCVGGLGAAFVRGVIPGKFVGAKNRDGIHGRGISWFGNLVVQEKIEKRGKTPPKNPVYKSAGYRV